MDKINIGYFATLNTGDAFIGCIMITDNQTIPVEFKYTDPIKPTKIHRIIFGKVLERYIIEEVIKKNLFKEIRNSPDILFVSDSELLGDNTSLKLPLVSVQATSLPELKGAGDIQRVKDREILIQPPELKHPLKMVFLTPDPDEQEKILNLLKSLIHQIDIFEPFTRLESALKTLCL